MYAAPQHPRPRRPGLHRPARRGQCCALRQRSTWPWAGGDDPEARPTQPRARCSTTSPRDGRGWPTCEQVHGRPCVVDGRRRRRAPQQCDALVTDRAGRRADGPRRRLRARAAGRRRRRASSGRRTPAATGVRRRRRHRRRWQRCATLGADDAHGLDRPARLRRCYEVPARAAGRGRRRRAGDAARRPRGARPRSTSAPGCAPSSSATGSRWSTSSRCTRESPDLYSYRRDGAAAGRRGWPGVIEGDAMTRARRDRRRPRTACASGSPRPAPTAGRDPDEITLVVVTKFFPASDVRLLADLGVHRRRREPPPGGGRPRPRSAPTSTLTLALRRRPAEQQGRRGRVLRRRRAVGRPRQARRRPRAGAPTSAAATVDVLLQVSLDPPGRRRAARAPTPPTCPRSPSAVDGRRACCAARPDGASRRSARTPVRPSRGWPRSAADVRRRRTRAPPGSPPA